MQSGLEQVWLPPLIMISCSFACWYRGMPIVYGQDGHAEVPCGTPLGELTRLGPAHSRPAPEQRASGAPGAFGGPPRALPRPGEVLMITRTEREELAERLRWAEWGFRVVQQLGDPDWYRAARAELEEAQAAAERAVREMAAG